MPAECPNFYLSVALNNMFVIKNRWVFFILSGLLVLASVFTLFKFGLNLGTDFTGGSILEVEYEGTRPEVTLVREKVDALNLGDVSVQESGDLAYLLRSRDLTPEEHQALLQALQPGVERRFSSVGPALGAELTRKGMIAMVIVIVLILIYIAFVFRQTVKPTNNPEHRGVSSWAYGIVAVITMIHDVLIPLGVFAVLGAYYGVEFDALLLTAFLTILGLSVNDKIVALDRIRENLRRELSSSAKSSETFAETVGRSLSETMTRSVNTSVTVILVLLAVYFFGGATTKYFALALTLGMIVATYCSIFIAAPLLVVWEKARSKK